MLNNSSKVLQAKGKIVLGIEYLIQKITQARRKLMELKDYESYHGDKSAMIQFRKR